MFLVLEAKASGNLEASLVHYLSSFKGFVHPPVLLFVIAFDFERLHIYHDIFFDGGMRTIIFEFSGSVGELSTYEFPGA